MHLTFVFVSFKGNLEPAAQPFSNAVDLKRKYSLATSTSNCITLFFNLNQQPIYLRSMKITSNACHPTHSSMNGHIFKYKYWGWGAMIGSLHNSLPYICFSFSLLSATLPNDVAPHYVTIGCPPRSIMGLLGPK